MQKEIIRKGKYKLIEWYEKSLSNQPGAYELFDLEADLSETTNLTQKYPFITDSLKTDLNQWKLKVKANLPSLNKTAIH